MGSSYTPPVNLAAPGPIGGTTPAAITGTIITGTIFVHGIEDGLTAHAGGTQAAALALSAAVDYHRISTCATAADSVKLPAATVGQSHFIRNDGAAACQVFGSSTDTINGIATGTGITLGAGQGLLLFCTTAAKWTTPFNPAYAGQIYGSFAEFQAYVDSPGYRVNGASAVYAGGFRCTAAGMTIMASVDTQLTWSSTADGLIGQDTGMLRASAGVIKFTDGGAGVGYPKTVGVAIASLPNPATVGNGTRGFVTDSNAAYGTLTVGVAPANGGAFDCPVVVVEGAWVIG